jgi:tetratricopeptide (TPR) repeat protein
MQSVISEVDRLLVSNQPLDIWKSVDFYVKLGRIDRALHTASQLVQQDGNQQGFFRTKYPEILQLGAEFAEEIGDYGKAAYYWEKLLQQQPQMSEAWYGLALAQANLGEMSQAQRALDRSLQINPQHTASQKLLASIRNSP